jgi:hypothetical protein
MVESRTSYPFVIQVCFSFSRRFFKFLCYALVTSSNSFPIPSQRHLIAISNNINIFQIERCYIHLLFKTNVIALRIGPDISNCPQYTARRTYSLASSGVSDLVVNILFVCSVLHGVGVVLPLTLMKGKSRTVHSSLYCDFV